MALGKEYCHTMDASMGLQGELQRVDNKGALVKDGAIRMEIQNQTSLIINELRLEFPDLENVDYWSRPPFEHPLNSGTISLIAATLTSTIGMQQITLTFLDADNYKIVGSTSGVIAATQAKAANYDTGGLTIPAANWDGTAVAGDRIYIMGYTVDALVVTICAKLTIMEIIENMMRNQALEYDLKLLIKGKAYWRGVLDALKSGKIDLKSRQFQNVGQFLNVPTQSIGDTGLDESLYREVNDPGYGSING